MQRNNIQTFDNYEMHMKNMLEMWIQNGLTSVYSLWKLDQTDLIPACNSYVDTIDDEAGQEQAVNAYKNVKNTSSLLVTTNQ